MDASRENSWMAQEFLIVSSNTTADTQVQRVTIDTSDKFETFNESRHGKEAKLKEINDEVLYFLLEHLKKKDLRPDFYF